jgi:tetratricopeptide (TPR) repeat protein
MSANRLPLRRDTRVFISAVSRELGTVRKLVKKALEDSGYHAVEQDNFPLDYRELVDKLQNQIASCDAVIHIAGRCFGAEPRQRPEGAPRRSYTQLEYDLARELGKPVYVFVTGARFPGDPYKAEDEEKVHLQEAHRQALMGTDQEYHCAASREDIDQKVRSLQFRVEALVDELTRTDEKVVATGTQLGRRLAVIFAVVLVVLATVGYLVWQVEKQRKEAQAVEFVQTQIAERLLDELLQNKDISADEARRRALAELPALVGLPPQAIQNLIDGKISARLKDASLSPLERAKAALAAGNYDAVFVEAAKQRAESRELAILEGTAALAQFRGDPKPAWNEKALSAFQRALALSDATQPLEWADAAVWVASVLKDLARYAEAEPLLREALTRRESKLAPNDPEIAIALNNLAQLLQATNRLAEAEPLYRCALTIDEAAYGPEHPNVAIYLNNLAQLLQDTNRLAEAEPLMRRALTIDEAAYGPEHPNVARDLNNLALLLKIIDRLAEAEPLMRRALAIEEQAYGPEHPDVARDLNNLAQLLKTTNRLAEAEPLYRRVVSIFAKSLGADHPNVAKALNNLALLLQATNRLAEAEPLMRRALAIDEAAYGPEHPDVARDLNNLALLLQDTNRLAEAEPLYRRALAIDEAAYGPEHSDVARDLNNLAQLLQDTNRLAEAEPLSRRMVGIVLDFTRRTGHEHPHLLTALENYAGILEAMGRSEAEIEAQLGALLAE